MRITVESTSKMVTLNGVPARIWEGRTESGIAVHCYITRIAHDLDADSTQFEAELQQTRTPSTDIAAIPARMIL